MTDKTVHLGRNVKRLREMMGMKQEALAMELGEDWNQKKISQLETKEEIDPALLQQIAKALHMPVETIRNFDEEKTIVNIQNNFDGSNANSSGAIGASLTYNDCSFNPLDKMVELYERMLKQQETLIERLEQLLEKK